MLGKPLALTLGEAQRSPAAADPERPRGEQQLWIAVHWPAFALQAVETAGEGAPAAPMPRDTRAAGAEAAHRASSSDDPHRRPLEEDRRPTVVVEASKGRLEVIALNDAARRRGIRRGFGLGAAFAFSGALRVLERSHRAERSLLEALAMLGQRFTPSVCLEPPDGLLLEVHASLALFGGIERLRDALADTLAALAPGFHVAVAPTPLAALWLARAGDEQSVGVEALASRLGRLPLEITRWPENVLELLEGIGVTTIGACLRLPRDGFARRVGKTYLEALDKSLGKLADPRAAFDPPKHLDFEIELIDESTSLAVFVDAVTRMTEQLARELTLRQAQVGKMELVFQHRRAEPSVHRLELLERTGNGLRLLELLCDKLERIELPAPATALRLSAGPLEAAVAETARLFKGEGSTESGARARLVERLRGRLGEAAVHGVGLAADHRPERAWTATQVPGVLLRRGDIRRGSGRVGGARDVSTRGAVSDGPAKRSAETSSGDAAKPSTETSSADPLTGLSAERPLWLAPAPEPLRSIAGKPHLGGRLRMIEGPERIESGWWDGEDIGRDYFVAVGPEGERLWVFRDRADGRWYLHGRFG